MTRLFTTVVCAVIGLSATTATLGRAAPAAQSPGDAVYRKLCRAIRPQHVRVLFNGPVAPTRLGGNADCDPDIAGVKVFLRIDDGDRTLWAHRGDHPYGTFHWLSKKGRLAKWGYQGGRLPSVVDARRGSFTCTLIPVGTDGLAIPAGSPLTAADTYAKRLLPLCDDVFAARG